MVKKFYHVFLIKLLLIIFIVNSFIPTVIYSMKKESLEIKNKKFDGYEILKLINNAFEKYLSISSRICVNLLVILVAFAFVYKAKIKFLKNEQEHLDDNKNLGIFFVKREQEFGLFIKEGLNKIVKTIFKGDNDKITLLRKAIKNKEFDIVFGHIDNSVIALRKIQVEHIAELEKEVKKYKKLYPEHVETIGKLEKNNDELLNEKQIALGEKMLLNEECKYLKSELERKKKELDQSNNFVSVSIDLSQQTRTLQEEKEKLEKEKTELTNQVGKITKFARKNLKNIKKKEEGWSQKLKNYYEENDSNKVRLKRSKSAGDLASQVLISKLNLNNKKNNVKEKIINVNEYYDSDIQKQENDDVARVDIKIKQNAFYQAVFSSVKNKDNEEYSIFKKVSKNYQKRSQKKLKNFSD